VASTPDSDPIPGPAPRTGEALTGRLPGWLAKELAPGRLLLTFASALTGILAAATLALAAFAAAPLAPVTVALPLQQLQLTGKEKPVALFVAVATFVGEQINPGLSVLSAASKLSYVS